MLAHRADRLASTTCFTTTDALPEPSIEGGIGQDDRPSDTPAGDLPLPASRFTLQPLEDFGILSASAAQSCEIDGFGGFRLRLVEGVGTGPLPWGSSAFWIRHGPRPAPAACWPESRPGALSSPPLRPTDRGPSYRPERVGARSRAMPIGRGLRLASDRGRQPRPWSSTPASCLPSGNNTPVIRDRLGEGLRVVKKD